MDLITEQRIERRARILSRARELIAEQGYEAVTVRALAKRCGVSVPTLYNQFGGKDGVLSAAIEDHLQGMLNLTRTSAVASGYERLLEIVDRCADQILSLAAYHRRLLEAFTSINSTARVQQRLAEQLASAMAGELHIMQKQQQLAAWAHCGQVAGQMTSACIGSAVVWSAGLVRDDRLEASLRYSTGLVLLGVVRGNPRSLLEQRVRSAQEQLTFETRQERTLEES
ncbi:MAG: helix-turn-helix domain containing protein [Gammaproteobacteria bacterium]|nr:helix-turn-helix domain containing protein [Gammaproteobacteria bacterium]